MTDVTGDQATYALACGGSGIWVYQGVTFPGLYALMHMLIYINMALPESNWLRSCQKSWQRIIKSISSISSESHIDDVVNSVMIADPLRILDCSPITDGAAAVIICSLETAKRISRKPLVKLSVLGCNDSIALHSRADLAALNAVKLAGDKPIKWQARSPRISIWSKFTIVYHCWNNVTRHWDFSRQASGLL